MREKVRRIKNEDGSDTYESMDGKQYKTRSGAWKRNQKLAKEEPPTSSPTEPTTEADPLPHDAAANWEPLSEKPPTATEEDPDFTGP